MHITCKYSTDRESGTGHDSDNYVASVSSQDESVLVDYSFRYYPRAKSRSGTDFPSIKSISLRLSKQEALKLAAAIIAQAHHPTIHGSEVKWIPPSHMPALERRWWPGLKLFFRSYDEITACNETKFHIGRVTVDVTYSTAEDGVTLEEHTAPLTKVFDLPPGQTGTALLEDADIPPYQSESFRGFGQVTLVDVTGVVPGDVEQALQPSGDASR